uniref:Transmembrane protein n=1 Tax=Triticum urartu TaxID=4572 RepID=A0A8R7TCX2_TRIUA
MGHPTTEKTSLQPKNYLMLSYLLKKLVLSWFPFACSIDCGFLLPPSCGCRSSHAGSHSKYVTFVVSHPLWFTLLSVLPIHVFLLICWHAGFVLCSICWNWWVCPVESGQCLVC